MPTCGAWFGASTPSVDGRYDYTEGLAEYEAVAHSTPDILHFYKTGAAVFPTAAELAMAARPGRQHSLLFYNWKPSVTMSWRAVANGDADAGIRTVAAGLRRTTLRMFLAIQHEPEDDARGPGSGYEPADYVAMYRHVVGVLRGQGVTNVVYVMNYMGFGGWSDVVDAFYPGDDVVDWIAYDPYAHAGADDFIDLLDQGSGGWPGFYSWAVAKSPGTPLMLGEWGFDLASQPASATALDGAAAMLRTRFPMLKALVYWNDTTDRYGYRLDQPSALGVAYGQAFAGLAADPYFSQTPVP